MPEYEDHVDLCAVSQLLATLQDQFTLLNNLPLPSDNSSPIENLVFNNYRILTVDFTKLWPRQLRSNCIKLIHLIINNIIIIIISGLKL